jgi:hypothetical protein
MLCGLYPVKSRRDTTIVFPPRRFLRVAEEIRTGDVLMDAELGALGA